MSWGPVDWMGRVFPEAKFENEWTLFFEFFWFERPILRYLCLGTSWMGWGPVDWVGKSLPRSKIRNQMDFVFFIFILFLFERPLLLKSESVTNLLTWVGARDTCMSKNSQRSDGLWCLACGDVYYITVHTSDQIRCDILQRQVQGATGKINSGSKMSTKKYSELISIQLL